MFSFQGDPVPDPVTADSIAEAAAAPASASVDGQSASAVSIEDQIKALNFKAQADAAAQTNENGGKRSGWAALRAARPVFPAHTN